MWRNGWWTMVSMHPQCLSLSLERLWLSRLRVKARYNMHTQIPPLTIFSLNVSQLDNKNCLQAELDRFCDTLISIREEIAQIEKGNADVQNNVLKVTEITNLIFSTVLHRSRRWGSCLFVCLFVCVFSGSSTFSSYANVRHMEEAVFPRVRCFPYPMAPICQVLANHRYYKSSLDIRLWHPVLKKYEVCDKWNEMWKQGVWTMCMETGSWCALSYQKKNKSQLQYQLDLHSCLMLCCPLSLLLSFLFSLLFHVYVPQCSYYHTLSI